MSTDKKLISSLLSVWTMYPSFLPNALYFVLDIFTVIIQDVIESLAPLFPSCESAIYI